MRRHENNAGQRIHNARLFTEPGIGFVCMTTKMTAKDAEKIKGVIGRLDKKRERQMQISSMIDYADA